MGENLLNILFGEEAQPWPTTQPHAAQPRQVHRGAKNLREGLRELARVALQSGAAGRRAAVAADDPGERQQAPGLVRAAGRDGRAAARRKARRGDGHAESNRRRRVRAEAAPRVGRRAAGRERPREAPEDDAADDAADAKTGARGDASDGGDGGGAGSQSAQDGGE